MPRVLKCCVPGCTDVTSSRHRFPVYEENVFNTWLARICNDKLESKHPLDIYKTYYVCGLHFLPACVVPNSKRLKHYSLPTIDLPGFKEEPSELNSFLFPPCSQQEIETSVTPKKDCRDSPTQLCQLHSSVHESDVLNSTPQQAPNDSSDKTGVDTTVRSSLLHSIHVTRQDQLTPKASKMYKIAAKLKRQTRILSKKTCSFRKRLRMAEEVCSQQNFEELANHVNPVTHKFILSQVRTQKLKPRGRRFCLDDKILALSVYKQSGKAYKLLSKIFSLPSRKTIMKLLGHIPFNTGINERVMEHLKSTVSKLPKLDKYCCLVFDEMAIEPGLQYSAASDVILGFEDLGGDSRALKFADHVLVLMIRGLRKKWKQPVAFYFCDSATKTAPLCKIIKDVIRSVRACGLDVVATVCDQGSSNQAAINCLLEETRLHCVRKGEENRYVGFLVDDEEVVPLYDTCHLLKGVRNNLLTKDLVFKWKKGTQKASWKHVLQFYTLDQGDCDLRMCPKLTDEHVLPEKIKKMKVSYCAQVFSQRVSASMRVLAKDGKYVPDLDVEAADTADFLLFIDKLFDSVNGAGVKPHGGKWLRCAVTAQSPHLSFWNEAIDVLRTVKFYDSKGNTSVPPSIKNWILTLQSLKYLWKKLYEYGLKFLCVRNLNQDPVENFFSCIRSHGYRNVNPMCSAFISSFKSLLVSNFVSPNSVGANCQEDVSTGALDTLRCFVTGCNEGRLQKNNVACEDVTSEMNLSVSEYNCSTHLDMTNPVQSSAKRNLSVAVKTYISGYLVRKIMKYCKGCKTCYSELSSTEGREEDFVIRAHAYSLKALCYPSTNFSVAFSQIAQIVVSDLPAMGLQNGLLKLLTAKICGSVDMGFMQCKEHKIKMLFVSLAVKMMIHTWCKNVNKILWGKEVHFSHLKSRMFEDSVKQLAYNKYMKRKRKR